MILLGKWIQTPEARALGWTLFHFLWEGVVIAAALALVLVVLRPARARYIAACVALAVMLVACVGTFVRVLPEQARAQVPASALLPRPPVDAAGADTHVSP